MAHPRRAGLIRLILVLCVAVLFGLGDLCTGSGCNPATGPQETGWDSCQESKPLGSGIESRDKCASAAAADSSCKAWIWDMQECVCCTKLK